MCEHSVVTIDMRIINYKLIKMRRNSLLLLTLVAFMLFSAHQTTVECSVTTIGIETWYESVIDHVQVQAWEAGNFDCFKTLFTTFSWKGVQICAAEYFWRHSETKIDDYVKTRATMVLDELNYKIA